MHLGGLKVVGVEVWHLNLGHFFDVLLGDTASDFFARVLSGLLETGLLAQEHRCWRRLQDETERTVFADVDFYWDDRAGLGLGGSVVLLDEVHDLDAMWPERRTNWWRRRCLASWNLNFY